MNDAHLGAPACTPGWFGKVVMLGDFAHRRLPQHFVDSCDAWLSQSIRTSRAHLGSRWLDCYLGGPVWQFAWSPGVVDERWWFGVLMPSVDAVGRYFPLVIAGWRENPPMSAAALTQLSSWYTHAGRAGLATLQPGASLERFEAGLANAPTIADVADAADARPERLTPPGRRRLVRSDPAALSQWAAALSGWAVEQAFARHSFWAAWQPEAEGPPALTMVPGLPAPEHYSAMLEGHW